MDDLISRQAAIDVMCLACGHDCDKSKFVYNAPQDEQVIMCPEHYALSTMPSAQPEPCEDAVSREEVIASVRQDCFAVFTADERVCEIRDLPPVTPKQRTGYWIPVGMVEVVGGESAMWGSAVAYHKCSECDGQALRDDFEQEVLSKWCPHCGAKMEGASE